MGNAASHVTCHLRLNPATAAHHRQTATFYTTDGVYEWLSGFVTSSWVDPVCGDGKCETPFEYPYYGHFGCKARPQPGPPTAARSPPPPSDPLVPHPADPHAPHRADPLPPPRQADCGEFKQLFNVTDIVIDLAYDFSHPPGAVPASQLFLQATWNICPFPGYPGMSSEAYLQEPPHGTDCYFAEDQQFPKETGTLQQTLDDIPNGEWQVVVRGDMFNKVRGAVRFSDDVLGDVVQTKQALAGFSLAAARFAEYEKLTDAVNKFYLPSAVDLVSTFNQQVLQNVRAERPAAPRASAPQPGSGEPRALLVLLRAVLLTRPDPRGRPPADAQTARVSCERRLQHAVLLALRREQHATVGARQRPSRLSRCAPLSCLPAPAPHSLAARAVEAERLLPA